MSSDPRVVLEVKKLRVEFASENESVVPVDDVSFSVASSEVIGLVGESGCGKSTTAAAILRLLDEKYSADISGEVLLNGIDLLPLPEKQMRTQRGKLVAYISQDPLTALNPVHRIGDQVVEAIRAHKNISRKEARNLAFETLEKVKIPDVARRFHAFPHQLSGGMRQRVVIAMALVMEPSLLIADEPTTALDVTTQAQILELFTELKNDIQTSIMLITHDLGVVAQSCSRVLVMYAGQIVEIAGVEELFELPAHPYSMLLMNATPSLEEKRTFVMSANKPTPDVGDAELENGTSPSASIQSFKTSTRGCRFAPRCNFATDICLTKEPRLEQVDTVRSVRCWNFKAVRSANETHLAPNRGETT